MKRLLIFLLVAGMVLISSQSFAQGGWGNFYVKSAGPYESSAFPAVGSIDQVRLESVDTGTAYYFRVRDSKSSEILATALTALSSGKPVRANIEKNHNNAHWSDYEIMSLFVGDTLSDLQ